MPDKTPEEVVQAIVTKLAEERARQKISKYELAARSGLSEQMIGYVEKGKRIPRMETLLRMSKGLKVRLSEILEEVDDRS